MSKAKRAPELRFKGFTGEWEQCKLKEITDIYDGTHQTPKYTSSGVKFVSVENIATFETEKYISQEAYNKEYSNKQAQKGDVLMTRIGDIGTAKVIEIDEPLAYYVTLALLKPKQVNSDFLAWLISSPEVQRDIWKRTLHIAFPKKINLGEINQVELMVPSNDEQTKIGAFFKELDNLITLHQRKLDAVRYLKQAYLQNMFPSNGESIPKVRFTNFIESWEQRKFSSLVTRVSKSNEEEELPRVEYEDVISGIGKLNKDIFNKKSNKKGVDVEVGDVLFGKLRPYLQNWLLADFKGIAVGDWWVLRPNEMDSNFIYSLIQGSKYQTVANLSTGTKMPRSDWKIVSQTEFLLPINKGEQAEIGTFFANLDNLITLHQQKFEKLNLLKKTYLQKIFI